MRVTERECCIAVPDSKMRQEIIAALAINGFQTVGEGADCFSFLRTLRQVQPHLAVMALDLPGDTEETALMIDRESIAALLLVTGRSVKESSLIGKGDLPIILLPAAMPALATVAEILCQEFLRRRKIYEENMMLKRKLKDRSVIETAKGILMKEKLIDEPRAHRILQKKSMESRLSMRAMAEEIIKREGFSGSAGF